MASRSLAARVPLLALCLMTATCSAARPAQTIAPTQAPTPTHTVATTAAPPSSMIPPPTATITRRLSPTRTRAPAATPTPAPVAIVQTAVLNLRSGPGTEYAILGKVTRGEELHPVGQFGACQWLLVEVRGRPEPVWVAGGAQYAQLNAPCGALRVVEVKAPTRVPATARPVAAATARPAATAAPRPATGLIDRYTGQRGQGELLIKNGTDSDGVVILVDPAGTPVQAAYIRAAESFRMTEIADGTYQLYFMKGGGWDAGRREFTRNVTRQRFQDKLAFATSSTQSTGYEVTLYGVSGGNAATENVPAAQFPGLP